MWPHAVHVWPLRVGNDGRQDAAALASEAEGEVASTSRTARVRKIHNAR